MVGIPVAGEVVQAATALAGLILVYLGSIAASYSAFSAEQQEAVRTTHFRRALFAFFGLLCALASAALAVVAKWLPNEALADAAVIVLFFAFGWGIVSAFLTVREVR